MSTIKITVCIILVLLVTAVACMPSLMNGFVTWDDGAYVVDNPTIKACTPRNLKTILTTFFVGNYQPVTMLTYLFEYQFIKLKPFWYHLDNLLLHLVNSILVFWLIYSLDRRIVVALIASLFFGVHPVHVESVAWVSERKDVLYALFFLASLIAYLRYLRSNGVREYRWTIIFFVLALLSKPMAITLPLILVLFDYAQRRPLTKQSLIEKIPFLALVGAVSFVTIVSQEVLRVPWHEAPRGALQMIAMACYALVFYAYKLFLPVNLSCFYPYYGGRDFSWFIAVVGIVVAAIIIPFLWGKGSRKLVVGCAFFALTLVPVLQFIPVGETLVADRYTYISSIGIFYIASLSWYWLFKRQTRAGYTKNIFLSIVLIVVVFSLSKLTASRCRVWKDGVSLWTDVLQKYPSVATAYRNRGQAYRQRGELEKALADFQSARSNRDFYYRRSKSLVDFSYVLSIAEILVAKKRYNEARNLLTQALKDRPDLAPKYMPRIAIIAALQGNREMAIPLLMQAVQNNKVENEERSFCLYHLALLYRAGGDAEKARLFLQESIKTDPGRVIAYQELAVFYELKGDLPQAMKYYRLVLQYGSTDARAYSNLSSVYFSMGKFAEAIAAGKKAVQFQPEFAQAYVNVGASFCALGKYKEAQQWLRKALALKPRLAVAYSNLASAYYFDKQYALAVKCYEQAVALGDVGPARLPELLAPYRK